MMTNDQPAQRLLLDNGTVLRFFVPSDADALARAVGESLEHLKPWMPWADQESAEPDFQRTRLRRQPQLAARGEEWQYGLFAENERLVLGSFGLMTRRGPGTIEIGYWVHVDAINRGHATRAVRALVDVAFAMKDVDTVLICCDEANAPSAAIPQKLGFTMKNVDVRRPEAPGESGRLMTWALPRDAGTLS
jgi:RimJ/RimL family protein N-acetyltransferase